MRVFAQESISTQTSSDARPARAARRNSEAAANTHNQRSSRNPTGESIRSEGPRFTHDFSRIPTHAPPAAGRTGGVDRFEERSDAQQSGIRATLHRNEPGDRCEQQADRVAHLITTAPADADFSGAAWPIERAAAPGPGRTLDMPRSVSRAIASPGRPLDGSVREVMERRFGRDFSHVRVHTDGRAADAASAIEARAYTMGRDIVFGAGQYEPDTTYGRRLLAHELSHVIQQQGMPPQIQRKPKEEATKALPSWIVTTPQHALEGVPVPGYETERESYTESDRTRMLDALNKRVQVNGQRLAAFYHDLRMVWLDLVVELAVDDAGMSLGAQTIAGIIGNLLSVPLGPGAGLIEGVIADGITNVTDDVMAECELAQRKQKLKEMMVAPEVSDAGESGANAKLAQLLLDAVSYTAWLQTVPLYSLSKFRIPAEFPAVREASIRFEVANAVIRWRANQGDFYRSALGYVGQGGGERMFTRPSEAAWWAKELIKVNPPSAPPNVVMVRMSVGRESAPVVTMATDPALYEAVQGRRIGDLAGVTVIATYTGFPFVPWYTRPDSETDIWVGDDPRAVAFGRDETGEVVVTGDFFSLKYMHDAASKETHPEDAAAENVNALDLTASESSLRPHYKEYATKRAKELLSKYIDPYILPVRK